MKHIQYIFEYIGLRILLFAIDILPLPAAERLASSLGGIWYFVDRSRSRTARLNIERSGITRDSDEINRIARNSFKHFAILIIESLKYDSHFTPENWREKITLDIPESTMNLLKKDRQGLILISGHFGNWEIAARILSYIKPVVAVTRPMKNPYTEKLMQKRKPKDNLSLTPKHDAGAGRFLTALKDGNILALLTDQFAAHRGMMVPFFGHPASTHTSPALLHFATKSPICFGYCVRTGPMRFTLKALEPMFFKPTGHREIDVRNVLETLNRALEDAIRQHPEQYLWAHRRWRD